MKAFELLAGPDKWTRGALARDAEGAYVNETSPKAVCWDILGALSRCYRNPKQYDRALFAVRKVIGELLNVSKWNDARWLRHDQVVAVLRKAQV